MATISSSELPPDFLNQASRVRCEAPLGKPAGLLQNRNALSAKVRAAPPILPGPALAPELVKLLPAAVESAPEMLDEFAKWMTATKLLSQTAVWFCSSG